MIPLCVRLSQHGGWFEILNAQVTPLDAEDTEDEDSAFSRDRPEPSDSLKLTIRGKNRLMLRYNNGREESAIIEDRNGQTFLDDQRFYMMKNNRCR